MLLRVKLFVLFLILLPVSYGQVINQVVVKGNEFFSKGDILDLINNQLNNNDFSALKDSIHNKLISQYSDYGYPDVAINLLINKNPDDTSKYLLNINISENERYSLKRIILNPLLKEDSIIVNDHLNYNVGRFFNKYEIEESFKNILSYYENNGYPFANIIINNLLPDSLEKNSYKIFITFSKENLSKIDKAVITGNSKTDENVILRELRLKPGEYYSQDIVNEIPAKLNKLKFFDPVSLPDFYINSKGEGILKINVKEKTTNNFDGVIGYIPGSTAQEKGYITGLVNVSLRNLFGTGRALAVRWQQLDRNSQEIELKYLEPWIFNLPINLSASLFQRKQDTTYVDRYLEGFADFLATDIFTASFFVSSREVIPNGEDSLRFTVYHSNILSTGVNLILDTRNDPLAPTMGYYFSTSYSFSRKDINGPDRFITEDLERKQYQQRITADIMTYVPLLSRQILALGVHGRELKGNTFETSDLYRLGGTSTLRGYIESQFLGSRVFWSNFEYRYLLTRRSYAFVFYDTGYFYWNDNSASISVKNEGFRTGYGFGLSLETKIGVLAVSYALGKGDSFSTGKIHFGIVNEF